MHWRDILDHPIVIYLVIGVFSAVAAFVFWQLGGGVAELVGAGEIFGASIKLGGALAGFAAVFLISLRIFTQLHKLQSDRVVSVFLIPPESFPRAKKYSCTVRIYDRATGTERTVTPNLRRDAGHLTVDLRGLSNAEFFSIEVQDDADNVRWESESIHLTRPRAEMKTL